MSFLNLMRNRLKSNAVNDALTNVVQKSPPDFSSSDAGKILAVDSNGELEWKDGGSYTPPSYSTTEVNTRQKWIDGKDIYCKTYSVQSVGNANTLVDSNLSLNNVDVVKLEYNLVEALSPYDNENFICGHITDKTFLRIWSRSDGLYANLVSDESTYTCNAIFTIYYTKSDPVTKTKKRK